MVCVLFCYVSSVSDGAYYLSEDLATLERHLVDSLTDRLRAECLQQMICPDMVKSVLAVRTSLFYKCI